MPVGRSSHVYNPSALEVWFGHLALEWESLFSEEALRKGREIYRNGQISGIELTDQHAVIHCTFTRKDTCYVVLEWDSEGKPAVRCSKDDTFLGNAVTVSGLYEIEELIADEIDPLPYEPRSEDIKVPDAASATSEKAEDTEPPNVVPARFLKPCFKVVGTALRLTAYWIDAESNRETAFQGSSELSSNAERELIVHPMTRFDAFKFNSLVQCRDDNVIRAVNHVLGMRPILWLCRNLP